MKGKNTKFGCLENKKSYLDKIKSIFQFLNGYHLLKQQKIADTNFKSKTGI